MKVLGKPKNTWGWVRVAGCGVLVGVLGWTALAAALRGLGEVPWMAWSGYPAFSLLEGIELAVLPLLAVFIGGWLEEHDHRVAAEHSNHREIEQVVAAQRGMVLKNVHEAVQAALDFREHDAAGGPEESPADVPALARLQINEIVRAALPELDGKGKGELLHFLFEHGLLNGEKPVVELNGVDFREVTIHKAQFNGVCLQGVDLRRARMDGARLAKGRLCGANLRKAFLRHADLREAGLAGSHLSGAHLEYANLEGADLRDAGLEGAFLREANLKNCVLNSLEVLDQAILIETIAPDGRKVTNEKGKEYLRNKEISVLVDRL